MKTMPSNARLFRRFTAKAEKVDDRIYKLTLYDASEPDRDGETMDLLTVTAREPVTLQVDHNRSVLMTVGKVTDIHVEGQRLRGTVTFAPEGVSEVADQIARQVAAGITPSVSVGFIAQDFDHTTSMYRGVEIIELSFVAVPSSPGARVDGKALTTWLGRADADDRIIVRDDDDHGRQGGVHRYLYEARHLLGIAEVESPADVASRLRSINAAVDAVIADHAGPGAPGTPQGLRAVRRDTVGGLHRLVYMGRDLLSLAALESSDNVAVRLRPIVASLDSLIAEHVGPGAPGTPNGFRSARRSRLDDIDDDDVVIRFVDSPDDELRIANDDLRGLPSLIASGLRSTLNPIVARELRSAINQAAGRLDD